jgi:predicted ferric reductase
VFLELPYEGWRLIHLLAFVGTALAAVHGFSVDEHLRAGVRVAFLGLLLAGYVALYVWVRFVRPLRGRRFFEVEAVSPLSHNVTQIELRQTSGEPLDYQPGQFAFLRLGGEEHPFTLSSSPSRTGGIAFSIKASGDYTGTLADTVAGAQARVMGPFGRFSYVHLAGGDLLLIAGGIGVTPMISMIRHLADNDSERAVTLLCANRTEADIVFREELDRLAAGMSGFRVVHVLSRQDEWAGEKGHIDAALLKRVLTARERAAHVFLCGPRPMMRSVRKALRRVGVPRARVHTETFTL